MSHALQGAFPREPGTYVLVFALAQECTLAVGRRRTETFHAGYHLYVGSALGGLAGRLRRHLIGPRRRHWHVDALLDAAPVIEIWYALTSQGTECVWASRLERAPGIEPGAARFGASDCRCRTHLFYSRERPTSEALDDPGVETTLWGKACD